MALVMKKASISQTVVVYELDRDDSNRNVQGVLNGKYPLN